VLLLLVVVVVVLLLLLVVHVLLVVPCMVLFPRMVVAPLVVAPMVVAPIEGLAHRRPGLTRQGDCQLATQRARWHRQPGSSGRGSRTSPSSSTHAA
jgi:hypothetical protein